MVSPSSPHTHQSSLLLLVGYFISVWLWYGLCAVRPGVLSLIVTAPLCTARRQSQPASTTHLVFSTDRSNQQAVVRQRRPAVRPPAVTDPDTPTATSRHTAASPAVPVPTRPLDEPDCPSRNCLHFNSKPPQVGSQKIILG